MTLKTIEYGSLASSEVMNNNFTYLEEKINATSEATNTSISSLLSNIATINTRLNDLVETFTDTLGSFSARVDDYKNKTKLMISENSMVPNWLGASKITKFEQYIVQRNGYILILLDNLGEATLSVNNVEIELNPFISCFPVAQNDVVDCDVDFENAYYIPATCTPIENF